MYKKYKRLLYTLLDLLARFCKVNLSKAKNSAEQIELEEEKKRKYQQRVLDVEMGSFTPLAKISVLFLATNFSI